jgi:hypothetical protein
VSVVGQPVICKSGGHVQEEKGDDETRPWGQDVLQAYMDKQLDKECALPLTCSFPPPAEHPSQTMRCMHACDRRTLLSRQLHLARSLEKRSLVRGMRVAPSPAARP